MELGYHNTPLGRIQSNIWVAPRGVACRISLLRDQWNMVYFTYLCSILVWTLYIYISIYIYIYIYTSLLNTNGYLKTSPRWENAFSLRSSFSEVCFRRWRLFSVLKNSCIKIYTHKHTHVHGLMGNISIFAAYSNVTLKIQFPNNFF